MPQRVRRLLAGAFYWSRLQIPGVDNLLGRVLDFGCKVARSLGSSLEIFFGGDNLSNAGDPRYLPYLLAFCTSVCLDLLAPGQDGIADPLTRLFNQSTMRFGCKRTASLNVSPFSQRCFSCAKTPTQLTQEPTEFGIDGFEDTGTEDTDTNDTSADYKCSRSRSMPPTTRTGCISIWKRNRRWMPRLPTGI